MKSKIVREILIFICICCISCNNSTDSSQAKGTMDVQILVLGGKTFTPQTIMDPVSFELVGSGPDGGSFSVITENASCEIADLALGEWIVTAQARNVDGTIIAEGTENVVLFDDQIQIVTIVVLPQEGVGSLELQVLWEEEAIIQPAVAGQLLPSVGNPTNLSFEITSPGVASCNQGEILNGYYTLVINLYDGETPVIGGVEVVRLVKDQITSGTIMFSDFSVPKGSLGATIDPRMNNALQVCMRGCLAKISLNSSMTLSAAVVGEDEIGIYQWYLNGQSFANTSSVNLGSELSVGVYRIDLAVYKQDNSRGGSDSHIFTVLFRAPYGALTFSHLIADGSNGIDRLGGVRDIVLSEDGGSLYAVSYNDDALLFFTRVPLSGELHCTNVYRNGDGGIEGLSAPKEIVISSDDKNVYMTGYGGNSIVAFSRDVVSGELSFQGFFQDGIDGVNGLEGARGIALSADGLNLYVTGFKDNGIAIFNRDLDTGELSFVSSLHNNLDGLTGMEGPKGVVVSPDGRHVYVAGWTSDSLCVFSRDSQNGMLVHTATLYDEMNGIDSLNGAQGLAIPQDGKQVLVACYYDSALTVFDRNDETGMLSIRTVHRDGSDGVDGLRYARAVTISGDGKNVYVTGGSDDAGAVFERDTESGDLTFIEYHKDGVDGVEGLDSPRGISVSSDGRHVYIAGSEDNAIAVFNRFVE